MKKKFLMFLLALVLLFGDTVQTVFAEETPKYNRDTSDIVYDLKDLKIDDKEFNYLNFGYDKDGQTQMLYFAEVGFSMQNSSNYALYLYVYNPTCSEYGWDSKANVVQMAEAFNEDGLPSPTAKDENGLLNSYRKFNLKYCNKTSDNLYIKYRVVDEDNILYEIVKSYMSKHNKRCYYISGIELFSEDDSDIVEYGVNKIYTYSGADKTLKCNTVSYDTIKLKVVPCYFILSDGFNDISYKQLSSVYFELPKKYIEEYGELQLISAEWYKKDLDSIFITNHKGFYDTFYSRFLFRDLSKIEDTGCKYGFGTNRAYETKAFFLNEKNNWLLTKTVRFNFGCNLPEYQYKDGFGRMNDYPIYKNSRLGDINFLFYADVGDLTDYVLPEEELLDFMYSSVDIANELGVSGLETVNLGRSNKKVLKNLFAHNHFLSGDFGYSFEELDSYYSPEKFDLTKVTLLSGSSFLDYLENSMGFYDYYIKKLSSYASSTDVVYEIKKSDLNSITVANDLCLSQNSYDKIKSNLIDIFESDSSESIPYLFRFDISDYFSSPGILYNGGWSQGVRIYKIDKSAYFDFDIIELGFGSSAETVVSIPVVASPVDIVNDTVPKGGGNGDDCKTFGWDSFFEILKIIGIVILIILLLPILPYVIQFVVWIVLIPIKAVSKVVDFFKKKKQNRKDKLADKKNNDKKE